MRLLFVLLLFSFFASAQTKTTLTTLKAKKTITSTTAKTMYYTVAVKDTSYWKWKPGMFSVSENVIITPAGAFVKMMYSQAALTPVPPVIPPVIPPTPIPTAKAVFPEHWFQFGKDSLVYPVSSLNKRIKIKGGNRYIVMLNYNNGKSVAVTVSGYGNTIGALLVPDAQLRDTTIHPSQWDFMLKTSGDQRMVLTPHTEYALVDNEIEIVKEGFDVAVRSGNSDLFSFKVLGKDYLQNGTVVVYPFRADAVIGEMTIENLPDTKLASNIRAGEIRPEDFGWKKIHTTGTFATAGSKTIKVPNPSVFTVGMDIMMAMREPNRVKQGPGGWGFVPDHVDDNDRRHYYFNYSMGSAWRGTVTKIGSDFIEVNNSCVIPYTGDIWADGTKIWNGITAWAKPKLDVTLVCSDTLTMSERWHFNDTEGWTVKGDPLKKFVFYSPPGVPYTMITQSGTCWWMKWQNFEIHEGHSMDNYAMHWWETAYDGGGLRYLGILMEPAMDLTYYSVATNLTFTKPGRGAIRLAGNHCKAENIVINNPNPTANYSAGGWLLVATGSYDSIISPRIYNYVEMRPTLETFGSAGLVITDVEGINVVFSSNGGQDWLVDGFNVTYTKNALPDWRERGANPIINLNDNNSYMSGKNGTFRNFSLTFAEAVPQVFAVQESINGAVIENGTIICPEYIRALTYYGNSLTLRNITVHSTGGTGGQFETSHIGIKNGVLENITAPVITIGYNSDPSTVRYSNIKGKLYIHPGNFIGEF